MAESFKILKEGSQRSMERRFGEVFEGLCRGPRTTDLVRIFKERGRDPRTADLVRIFKGQ